MADPQDMTAAVDADGVTASSEAGTPVASPGRGSEGNEARCGREGCDMFRGAVVHGIDSTDVETRMGAHAFVEARPVMVGPSLEITSPGLRLPEEPILRYFEYAHLPLPLAKASAPFAELAEHLIITLPRCAERTVALRKLLESKDAAVRAALPVVPAREAGP